MAFILLILNMIGSFILWLTTSIAMGFYMALVGVGFLFIWLKDSVTMGFVEAVIGSGLGAYAGAAAVWMLDKEKESKKDLAAFNSYLIIFSNTLGKLISLKKALLPIYTETIAHKNTIAQGVGISIKNGLQKIITPKFPPLEKMFDFVCSNSSGNYRAVALCERALTNIDEILDIVDERNELLMQLFESDEDKDVKIPNAFGARSSTGEIDNNLYDLTVALNSKIDTSLFYCFYGHKEFRILATKVLPKKLQKHLVSSLHPIKDDSKLIPEYDFIRGFYDNDPGFILK